MREDAAMGTRLVLRLAGENARWGEVYVSDFVRLLDGMDRVVGRTASQLAGRAPGMSGPLPQSIANATKLRLSSISEGSLVVEVEVPDAATDESQLELDDARLGESAVHTALDVLTGSETGFPETIAAWSRLAEDLSIGERYDALTCALLSDSPREAVLDAPARRRLALGPAISDFWTTRSLAELAEEQGVEVVDDVGTLQDESISDEEAEAFIAALGL